VLPCSCGGLTCSVLSRRVCWCYTMSI
jgi:hypothetical protein